MIEQTMQSLQMTGYTTAARSVANDVATKLKDMSLANQKPLLSNMIIPQVVVSPRDESLSLPYQIKIDQNVGE